MDLKYIERTGKDLIELGRTWKNFLKKSESSERSRKVWQKTNRRQTDGVTDNASTIEACASNNCKHTLPLSCRDRFNCLFHCVPFATAHKFVWLHS